MRTDLLATVAGIAVILIAGAGAADTKGGQLSGAAIKQRLIRASIASYPGNCPCPYNSARNGSSCGGRSAWSRAGGYAPLCYPTDVSKSEVEAYRRSHALARR